MSIRRKTGASVIAAAGALMACSPALDWRELAVPEAGLIASFPCKPQRVVQQDLGLMQCEAAGLRFVLAWQRWQEPQQLRASLASAAPEAARRAGVPVMALPDVRLPEGALAWAGSGRFGLGDDAQAGQMLFWARGLTGYRAIVTGKQSAAPATLFFDGLRSAN